LDTTLEQDEPCSSDDEIINEHEEEDKNDREDEEEEEEADLCKHLSNCEVNPNANGANTARMDDQGCKLDDEQDVEARVLRECGEKYEKETQRIWKKQGNRMEGMMWRMGRCGTTAKQVRWRAWSLRENWKEYWAHEEECNDEKCAEEDVEVTKKGFTYKQVTNVKDVVTYKAEPGCKYKMIPHEYLWKIPDERAPTGDDYSEDDYSADEEDEKEESKPE